MKNYSLFYDSLSVSEALQLLIEDQKEIIKSYKKVIELVQFAYDNQEPHAEKTPEGTIYHIRHQDFSACENALHAAYKIEKQGGNRLLSYYNSFDREKGEQLKSDFRPYAEKLLSIKSQARGAISGHLSGLQYVYENPNPSDRRRIEYRSEREHEMRIMFGFS